MDDKYGFVYFLSNDAMPGIYKIGFTTNHPRTRLEQLSASTSCPLPFELSACFGTCDPRDVEQEIHQRLNKYRINSSREFFKCSPNIIKDIVHEYSDEYVDLVNSHLLDNQIALNDWENRHKWEIDYFHSQCCDPIEWPKFSRGLE